MCKVEVMDKNSNEALLRGPKAEVAQNDNVGEAG